MFIYKTKCTSKKNINIDLGKVIKQNLQIMHVNVRDFI